MRRLCAGSAMTSGLRRLALACAALLLPHAACAADALEARIDRLLRDGFDHPAAAIAQLRQLRAATPPGAAARLLLQTEGLIQAQAGREAEAHALADELREMSRDGALPLAAADASLVRAVAAQTAGQLAVAATHAESAAAIYQPGCSRTADGTLPAQTCDYRALWRALQLLERRAMSLGRFPLAQQHAQTALDLADAAGDIARKALSLGSLAFIAANAGQHEDAQRSVAQAKRMAAQVGDAALMARAKSYEALVADLRGDADAGLRATEEAYELARQAGARRLQAQLLVNLSDSYVRRHRPADALRAANEALPTVREFNDRRTERTLVNNAGLAKIGLRRIAEGRKDMARVLEFEVRSGAQAEQATTLREFGQALAAVGEMRDALELYHRERALSAQLMQRNQDLALKEMQARYDAEAEQRRIELVRSDNALKTAALANRDLTQRIWLVLAALMTLSVVFAVLLVRRVRETHRRLEASHALLRVASERDALTDLANRRHFHAVMQATAGDGKRGFAGSLLLVDIDHFKHINDGHGHAAGDVVLIEVARRLNAAVRDEDLVVRWGGEEFLIVAEALGTEQADQLAARVLASIGSTPVLVENQALWVTASIGYASFPLPPHRVALQWEQAVNLADMALYTAKSQGRNRAVGLVSASASDAQSLRAIEGDFERAWHEGRVTLRQTPGPGAPDATA
ncbi:putative signaling protein [Burkholderiaceae bacterium]|nr:putative signaling protein [Burkholderiaceae bacterium]